MSPTGAPTTNDLTAGRMRNLVRAWIGAGLVTAAFCFISIKYLDMPIARSMLDEARLLHPLGDGLGSPILISLITAVILPLCVLRLIRGSLSQFGETIIVAGYTAIGTFAVNDFVLKRILGRKGVLESFSDPLSAGFHWLGGTPNASFPSGHAVLATAGLVTIVRVYPRHAPMAIAALAVIAILLVAGDWHFLSDVAAGIFVGASAGLLAGELAISHFGKVQAEGSVG